MLKFLLLLALLFAVALGFHALSNTSGELALTLGDTVYAVNLSTAVVGAIVLVLVGDGPHLVRARRFSARRGGWRAASGTATASAGAKRCRRGWWRSPPATFRAAERAMLEASRRAPDQPLTLLLKAQTAQLKGDRDGGARRFPGR